MPEEQICGWFACLQFHLLVCASSVSQIGGCRSRPTFINSRVMNVGRQIQNPREPPPVLLGLNI